MFFALNVCDKPIMDKEIDEPPEFGKNHTKIEDPPQYETLPGFKQKLNSWAENTTMHGVASLVNSNSMSKKVIWVVFL